MRPRQIAIFLGIVLIPLAIAAWLGLKVARDEQAVGRHQFQALLESRLRDVDRTIARTIDDVERELLERVLTTTARSDTDLAAELRRIRREQPIVHELFWVDGARGLIFPPEGGDASDRERAFRQRTAAIWRGDAVLYEPPAPAGVRPSESSSALRHIRPVGGPAPQGQGDTVLALAENHPYGWLGWHWEEGLHLLFWRRTDTGVMGAEIERMYLLARIVGKLPVAELDDGRVVLIDARGNPVHQWGPYEPESGEAPAASAPVTYPLNDWRLLHYASPRQGRAFLASSLRLNLIVGFLAVALALASLAFLFYRDYARKMRDAAERVNFVTQVSHELKTPLTNIRLYAELMDGDLDEEDERARKRLSVIVAESQRLTRLINNILAFSRKRQERLEVRRSWIQVDEVVAAVLEQFEPALAAKEIETVISLGAKNPGYADPDVVGQIVANLVSNVEKYAASGRSLEVTTRQSGPTTRIRVADRGPGIPAGHRDKVFRPFYRVSDKLADGVTGTGIGLSIARELARLSGGELTLVSSDSGACFELSFDSPASTRPESERREDDVT